MPDNGLDAFKIDYFEIASWNGDNTIVEAVCAVGRTELGVTAQAVHRALDGGTRAADGVVIEFGGRAVAKRNHP